MNKKLIGCPTGKWAERLFTVERFGELAYFIDDYSGEFKGKEVHTFDSLSNENPDDILIIIDDSAQYDKIAKKLSDLGFLENINFFNGWKLSPSFYKMKYDREKNWIQFEQKDTRALERQKEGWKIRAEFLSKMIPDDVKSIMDIGCGDGLIKNFLGHDVKYFGVDYCKRSADTIVCDINQESLPDLNVDLYYMAGVIDYIENIRKFVAQLSRAKYVLISKVRNEKFIRLDARYTQGGIAILENWAIFSRI